MTISAYHRGGANANECATVSTTSLMFALLERTGGSLAESLRLSPTRGCTEILNHFRYKAWSSRTKDTTPTGCTRWGVTVKGANFVALDGTKAERELPVIGAWGGVETKHHVTATSVVKLVKRGENFVVLLDGMTVNAVRTIDAGQQAARLVRGAIEACAAVAA